MGDAKRRRQGALIEGGEADPPQVVDTLGGRMHVRWDQGAAATPHGQLVYFAEFLATTGVFERWVSSCPLEYRSGNAPSKRDVLGTLMLGLLAGHRRYAHITALRGDAVAAQALGMNTGVRHFGAIFGDFAQLRRFRSMSYKRTEEFFVNIR